MSRLSENREFFEVRNFVLYFYFFVFMTYASFSKHIFFYFSPTCKGTHTHTVPSVQKVTSQDFITDQKFWKN